MCRKHLEYLKELKSDKIACLEIRNHISWYFKGVNGASILKNRVFQCKNVEEIQNLLNEFEEEFDGR